MVRTLLFAELTADALTPGAKLGVYGLTGPRIGPGAGGYVRATAAAYGSPAQPGRVATRRQLAAEDLLIAAGAELGGPAIEREHAAAALGGLPAALEDAPGPGAPRKADTLTAQQGEHGARSRVRRRRGESLPPGGHPYPEIVGPSGQQDLHGAATGDVHAKAGTLTPKCRRVDWRSA